MSSPSRAPDPISSVLQGAVAGGDVAGVATLVWRAGRVVHRGAAGWQDLEAAVPVQSDALWRIASMSKPVTTVAALQLLEEGRFALEDPVHGWAAELREMRVLRSVDGALDDTVLARRPVTFDDLLTHRSGLTYGAFWPGPLADAYQAALGGDIDSPVRSDEWIARLAALPLIDQPGHTFHYGRSTDLLGLLLERMEDAPLEEVLRRRIFGPLGMKDTGFVVPPAKRARRAALYGFDRDGRLARRPRGPGGSTVEERPLDMTYVSGGQGLWSTLDDYLSFALLFLRGGQVDGVRVLRPETVTRMMRNHLSPEQRRTGEMGGVRPFVSGYGFGLGVAVVVEPGAGWSLLCGGGLGAVGWPGGFGGWWRADPRDDSVAILLCHRVVEPDQLARGIGLGVFELIERFQALASEPAPLRPE